MIGCRAPSGVELTDSRSGNGPGLLVDRGFRCFEQLAGFIGDYLEQAAVSDACPMSGEGIGAMLDCTEPGALAPLLGGRG